MCYAERILKNAYLLRRVRVNLQAWTESGKFQGRNYCRSGGKFIVGMAKEAYHPPESKRNRKIPMNYASINFRVVLNNHDSLEAVWERSS